MTDELEQVKSEEGDTEYAAYVVIRADLKLNRGKEIAQAIHAAYPIYQAGLPMIVLRADSEEQMATVLQEAIDAGDVPVHAVADAGRTSVPRGTRTAISVGPVEKGRLKLLSLLRTY